MSCRTPCAPKNFLSATEDAAKEIVDRLSNVILPDAVNAAIDSAVKQKKDTMIAEGKSKIVAAVDWNKWTYSTGEHFFMIERDNAGQWWITSQWNYWHDPQRWNSKSVSEKLSVAADDVETLNHLLDRARFGGDIERYLEE